MLQYDWFFDDTDTVCVVRETYQDSESLLTHIAAMGEVLNRLSELGGGCELEMLGDPSPQLIDLTAPLQRSIFRHDLPRKMSPLAPSPPRCMARDLTQPSRETDSS